MEITREQQVVNDVAQSLENSELNAPCDVQERAQIRVVARWAFRAGKITAGSGQVDPLGATKELIGDENNTSRVFQRAFEYVRTNPAFADLAIWAFGQGHETVTSGVGER